MYDYDDYEALLQHRHERRMNLAPGTTENPPCDGRGVIVELSEPRGSGPVVRPDALTVERTCPGCARCEPDDY